MSAFLHHGDALEVLPTLDADSFDAVVTDPPYGLEFMGREWDGADGFRRSLNPADVGRESVFGRTSRTSPEYRAPALYQQWCQRWAVECLRLLKPGGHLLAFGGSRTFHRLACAIEDAGFEIRDTISWLYGSGFPKSLDVSKAIDKAAGVEREIVGESLSYARALKPGSSTYVGEFERVGPESVPITAPATDAARHWQGWGTALKPAWEPIIVARKPLAGTVAGNVQAHGTGALNIAACRVGTPEDKRAAGTKTYQRFDTGSPGKEVQPAPHDGMGRWPTNAILDEHTADELDRQSGDVKAGGSKDCRGRLHWAGVGDSRTSTRDDTFPSYADIGGASRFFPTFRYEPKATTAERPRVNGTAHPTVKPLDLMRWLVRLVTPPGGVVLDPFAGSGTTGEAAIIEGFRAVLIEREADYLPLIEARLSKPLQTVLPLEVAS